MSATNQTPVAVVGLSSRLPGAGTVAEFWQQSLEAESAVRRITAAPMPGIPTERWAGSADGLPFPWERYRIPPVQLASMHRMERLLLEALVLALEDAGYSTDRGPGRKCAIYIGSSGLGVDERIDHTLRLRAPELNAELSHLVGGEDRLARAVAARVDREAPPISPDSLATTASVAAGRIAALFDTWGGHFAVDVGAASALAALHLARQSLALGHCDVAVVGAVSPALSPSVWATLEARGWLSSLGLKPLDETAAGTFPGEGAAAIVLRRIEDAHADRQRMYAVMRASAESSEGMHRGSRGMAQAVEAAARTALDGAGIEAEEVAHVELQAPGITEIEDEELFGLRAAFALRRGPGLSVGSAVAQGGFLGAASAMPSLLRAVLAVHARRLPASRVERPREKALGAFRVGTAAAPLNAGACVGVSALAATGTAFHALFGPAPQRTVRVARTRRDGRLAVIGMGAVAPDASDVQALWRNVLARTDAIRDLPSERFDVETYLRPVIGEEALLPRLAGTAEVALPDPAALKLPPAAIERLDRAVLLALQAGEEAVRSAGYDEGRWDARRVKVIFGQLPLREREVELERRFVCERYLALAAEALREEGVPEAQIQAIAAELRRRALERVLPFNEESLQYFTGSTVAARLAARFGFSGGAWSVDAACASSLVAVHAAAIALQQREADVVLVGGVAANLVPEYYATLSLLGALSARGIFPFDDRADGFVPAEAAGAVVLKRLEDAEAAKDRIVAVIGGIGFSSDGRGTSLVAPNPEGQALAVERALAEASVDPGWIGLVEAHGSATRRSDVSEATAYGKVFAARGRDEPVALGSIKSQVGHTSSAGGMLGLIKTSCAISEAVLPPMNGGEYPNPEIPFDRLPLALSQEARPWRLRLSGVRRAGVSAFGLGGSNYHLVLEEHDNLHLRTHRVDPEPSTRPFPQPHRGLFADRWAVDLVPRSLGAVRSDAFAGKRVVLLGDPAGPLTGALLRALASRGAISRLVETGGEASIERVQQQVEEAIAALGGVDGVIDLSAAEAAPYFLAQGTARFSEDMQRLGATWFGAARAVYRAFAEAPPHTRFFAAPTAMGGDFGFIGDGGNVLGGAIAGFLKGLKQELPGVIAKAVDFDPADDPSRRAERLLDEIANGSDRVEIGYPAGRRMVVGLRRASFTDEQRVLRRIDPSWVLLFSGGGRGAVFEVARAVARLGPRVIVTGRTPVPSGEEPWLRLDDEAFERYRREEMLRRRQADPTLTPVRFAAQFEPLERARELWRNLSEAFAEGLPIQYEVCDVRDPEQVRELVAGVRASHGRIDGVVHGAMLESSRSLPDKSPQIIAATLGVKVEGLANLLEATRGDELKLVMCFGSGAGRFGNKGQSDYCGANDLMSKCLMAWAHRNRPSVRCVTIDWTAWDEVGAAARARQMVENTGVSFISPAEGAYWFVNEFMLGEREREVAIFDERLFREWPFLGSSADGPGPRTVTDDRGRLMVPSDFPMLATVRQSDADRLTAFRTFSPDRDRFLQQHQLYGTPIMPGTFGLELLAEAAALFRTDLTVLRGESFEIEAPLKFFRNRPVDVTVTATAVGMRGDELMVEVESSSELRLGNSGMVQKRLHHRGRFLLGRAGPIGKGAGGLPEALTGARARSIFHLAKDPVFLGPLFCRAEWVFVAEQSVQGIVRAPRQRDLFTHITRPWWQFDPLLLDSAFQVAANWDGHHTGKVSIPVSIEAIARGRTRRPDESAHVHARVLEIVDRDVFYDIDVRGDDGAMLLEVRRLCLRRLDPGGVG